jgi:pimeloyl-ACP methyl ester carboxylesterase
MATSLTPLSINVSLEITLSGVSQGRSDRISIVLLHGYTDSWRSYELLLAWLPTSLRAVALSQRGHGDSTKPETTYRLGDFANDVCAAMNQLAFERAFVIGHSMGSLVATRFALDHPDRVAGLGLIGAFPTLKGNRVAGELWREGVSTLADPVDPEFVRAFQESTLARPLPPAFLATVIAESRKVPAFVWRSALRAMLDEDFSGELGSIAAPTLIIWGDEDSYSGRDEQARLLDAIPRAALATHRGAGHAPHWEDAARVATELADFIARVTVPATA